LFMAWLLKAVCLGLVFGLDFFSLRFVRAWFRVTLF